MTKVKLTKEQAHAKYKHLIEAWRKGEDPRPQRSGRLPKEILKIKEAIMCQRAEAAKKRSWFTKHLSVESGTSLAGGSSRSQASTSVGDGSSDHHSSESPRDNPGSSSDVAHVEEGGDESKREAFTGEKRAQPVMVDVRKPWLHNPSTVQDLEALVGRLCEVDNTRPGLYHFKCPSPEEAIRSPCLSSVPEKLAGRDLWVWSPFGGRCPKCNEADITIKQLLPVKVVLSDGPEGGWHGRLASTRRRCGNPQCRHSFSSLSYKFIKTLPVLVADSILNMFVLSNQCIVPISIIRRLRDGGMLGREAEILSGLERMALGKRRAFFNEHKRRCAQGTLANTVSTAARDICEVSAADAIPEQTVTATVAVLRGALLKDLKIHKLDLLRELGSYKIQHSLSIDHTRSVPKRVTTNRNGYLVVFVADAGTILNAVSTTSTSMAELVPALRQLRGNIDTDMLTIYVDRDCCGTAGANNRAMIAAALEREPNSIQLKVDALHIIFRLLRNTTDNHSRQTRFASALSKCFFVDNNMDVAVFRAERAKAGLVDKPASREEVRRHVRRMIPPPVELRRRLEACVRTFWELDCEGEASTHPSQRNDSTGEPLPGSVGAPLLKEGFWSAFRSVLVHVDGNCVSDSEDSVTFIRDGQGGLRHIRGSSRSECRHACIKKDFSQTSRVSGELYDCKLLWRMIFSNRRLKMKLGGEIDGKETIPIPLSCREYQLANLGGNSILVSSEPPEIVFGHEYLRLIDEERYSAICREWEEEKLAAEGCLNLDAEEDTGDAELEREILQHASGDGEEDVEFDVESAEDVPRNGAFEEIRSGGKARRKFCRLRGLHATNCIIKLENWSPYVTSVLRELISQVPDQNSETIYRLYVKRVLDEVDSAMRDCAVKAPLPLHSISLDDVKTYLKRLNHIRSSAIPATVRGQEAAARLELDLRSAVKLVFPEPRPGTQRLISPVPLDTGPTPVTSSDVIDDIVKRSALQGTAVQCSAVQCSAVQCSAVTAHTPHEATTEIVSSQSRGTAAHSSNECVDVAEPPAIERPSTAKSGTPRPDPLKKICRFCSKPLVDGYNSHVPDGSKFGRCPLDTRPGMDAESKAMRTRARERAKSVTVAVSGVGRSCGMCGIRLTAVITGLDGSSIPKHEQFADEQGKHVRFCPLAENVPPDELEALRVLKKRRAEEKKERRNSNKRRRYNDEKATGGPQ